jgi:poly(A) polymerase
MRPALDGNEIMDALGVGPGPIVGRAWKYLLELRIERGPMTRDEALAALRDWAQEQGLGPE